MNFYVDTSALVKRYIREEHSEEFITLIAQADRIGTSLVTLAEVSAAIGRLARNRSAAGEIAIAARDRFLRDESSLVWLDLDRELAGLAGEMAWRHELRGFDAIQLSSALRWARWLVAEPLTFATFDRQLARAAEAEGLTVWPAPD